MRFLRLCFEPGSGVHINDAKTFRHLAENYLSGFDMEFAGFVSLSSTHRRTNNMEPVWQYMIRDHSEACRDYLVEYIGRNPMAGYHVHVYENTPEIVNETGRERCVTDEAVLAFLDEVLGDVDRAIEAGTTDDDWAVRSLIGPT